MKWSELPKIKLLINPFKVSARARCRGKVLRYLKTILNRTWPEISNLKLVSFENPWSTWLASGNIIRVRWFRARLTLAHTCMDVDAKLLHLLADANRPVKGYLSNTVTLNKFILRWNIKVRFRWHNGVENFSISASISILCVYCAAVVAVSQE